MKKVMALCLAGAMLAALAGCGSKPAAPAATTAAAAPAATEAPAANVTYFKLGHTQGTDSPVHFASERMNELLKEKMPQYQLDLYPSSQLGGERDMIEAVQLGSQDMVITATTPLCNFVPEFMPGDLLYLIQDYDHADAVYQGEIGKSWLAACENANMHGIGFTEVGFRHMITAKKEVHKLADIKGMKMRVMENEAHVNGWKLLGMDAVTTSFADAFSGMQQGSMDAMELPWCLIWANSFYDVAKYVIETRHIYTAQCCLMSDKAWKKMSADEQKTWMELWSQALAEGRTYCRENEERFKKQSIEKGMTVIDDVDTTEWREAAKGLYEQYSDKYGDMIKKIQGLAK